MVDQTRPTTLNSIGWSAVDKWGTRITSLIVIMLLGRVLDAETFGILALATVYTALAAVFVDSGFGRSLVQKHQVSETDKNTAFWINVTLGILLAITTILVAPTVADLFAVPQLSPVLQALSVGLLFNALSSTPAALLERDFRFKALAMRRSIGTICGGIAAISFALAGFGVWSLVAQTLVAATVSTIALWVASDWRPGLAVSVRSFKDLRTVGLSVMGIELIGYANSQADKLLVGIFMSAESLGYYYIALQITTVATSLFSSVFGDISLTKFSRVQNDTPLLIFWFMRLTSISSIAAIPVFALMAASAPTLIPFILGQQWEGSVPIVQILTLLGIINAAIIFDRNLLIAKGQGRLAFRMTLGQALLGIALLLPLLQFGVVGVATAVVLRQYLFWPVRLYQVKRAVPLLLRPYFMGWLAPLIVGIVAFTGSCIAGWLIQDKWPESQVLILACQAFAVVLVTLPAYLVMLPELRDLLKTWLWEGKKARTIKKP